MWERGFEQGDGLGKVRLLGGWGSVVGGGAFVVWLVFRPFPLTWSQVFGAAVGLSVAELLLRRWGWARRWGRRIPSPGRVVGALVSRVGVSLPLSGSRWGRARSVAVGLLLFGSVAGIMGWEAGQENQLLHDLREHGRRAEATVVAIVEPVGGRLAELPGRALRCAVRRRGGTYRCRGRLGERPEAWGTRSRRL